MFESSGPINLALRTAHAAGWGMLPLLALMWLPVMRSLLNLLETTRIGRWLPLESFRSSHRLFGWIAITMSLVHGIGWLVFDATLSKPFLDALLGQPAHGTQGLVALLSRLWSSTSCINISGLLLGSIFLLLGWTSRAARRKRAYDSFQRRHLFGYIAGLLLLLHVQPPFWGWLLLPVPVLLIELWLLRRSLLQRGLYARVHLDAPGIVSLTLPSSIETKPGHYVQLRIPTLDDSWHAFSLADSGETGGQWVIKINAVGDWSTELAKLADFGVTKLAVDVRGPFASPAAQGILSTNCLLACGGIGVTPFLSLVRGFIESERERIVHFVWVVRHPQLLHWIMPLANALARRRHVSLHWHLYLDGQDGHDAPLPSLKRHDGETIKVQRGRPNWDELLSRIAQHSPHLSTFTCGPGALMEDVKRSAQALGWPVRTEKFG
ncbi:ferric reductase-like transmembrane domain-containing protein [Vogesella sp. LIG4]|uniref:NADPH oxidase family protein n=1 Tax=Vogesella sp. LIG4 TaxID=1192162 RepID=UPI0013902819|nr:ferric reductase-like transmembrane domain-containing protein [Vogesella sp. LIG4]